MSTGSAPSAAIQAFDALAPFFDARFGAWKSVDAQRAAVRAELLRAFRPGASLLELAGGTGDDALFLAERGYRVLLTDGSPAMVALAREKVLRAHAGERVTLDCIAIEELSRMAETCAAAGITFDGCYSNFAAFNCVEDLHAPAQALARLLAPGALALIVVFGPFCPGETLTLLLRGKGRQAFRRLARRKVSATVGGHAFTVSYPTPLAFARSFAPWFALRRVKGIGVFVPPSSAEPRISRYPRLLAILNGLDRVVSSPLAILGDHVLITLERTGVMV